MRKADLEKDGSEGLFTWCQKKDCKRKKTYDPTKAGTPGYACTLHPDKNARDCPYISKHRKKSIIHNPRTGKQDCIRTHPTNNLREATKLHLEFRQELEDNNYFVLKPEPKKEVKPIVLTDAAAKYIDYLKGLVGPEHKRQSTTNQNWKKRLGHLRVLFDYIGAKYKLHRLLITSVDDNMVGYVYKCLESKETPKGDAISGATFNDYIKSWTSFYGWLINKEKHDIINPFEGCNKKPENVETRFIEDHEFDLFISMITPENSIGYKGSKKQQVNYWRDDWLIIFTGLVTIGSRREDFFQLKVSSIDVDILNVIDSKNKAIKGVEKTRPLKIQGLLAKVLDATGYLKRGKDEYLFGNSYAYKRSSLMALATKAFRYYWDQTGLPHATLHDLRKTFVTKAIEANGKKAVRLTHDNEKTLFKHYHSAIQNARSMEEGEYNYKHVIKELATKFYE